MYGLWLRVPRPTQDQVVAAFNSNVAPLRTHFVDEGSLTFVCHADCLWNFPLGPQWCSPVYT